MIELKTEDFTKNLKRLRQERGFTQESLAEKLEMTHSTVNRWESGKNAPGYKDFFKLMQAFNVSFEELAGANPSKTNTGKPTVEEALNAIAVELGMEIKITKPSIMDAPLRSVMPEDLAKKLSSYGKMDRVWDAVRGILDGKEVISQKDADSVTKRSRDSF